MKAKKKEEPKKEEGFFEKASRNLWVYLAVVVFVLFVGGWVSEYSDAVAHSSWTAEDYIQHAEFERKVELAELSAKISAEYEAAQEEARLAEWRETDEYLAVQTDFIEHYAWVGFAFILINLVMMMFFGFFGGRYV